VSRTVGPWELVVYSSSPKRDEAVYDSTRYVTALSPLQVEPETVV
jgi:hypothetical protein